MKNRLFWRCFFLVAALLTAVLIFFFSSQDGEESSELSDGVTLEVAQIVRPDYKSLPRVEQQSYLESLGGVVRKCAHFCEFALLAFNLMFTFSLRRDDGRLRPSIPIAWGIATLYAGTDELHQRFVSDRGPALLDVGIDSAGALTGALVATVLLALLLCRAAKRSAR
ncbi:MAG: VanZ family protein [Clostridia bacterium]|nr:VanZ family protein [Clostridia bacterium]